MNQGVLLGVSTPAHACSCYTECTWWCIYACWRASVEQNLVLSWAIVSCQAHSLAMLSHASFLKVWSIADCSLQALERVIPDVRSRAELTLIGSPLTHERFLRRHKGTYGPGISAAGTVGRVLLRKHQACVFNHSLLRCCCKL
jgi:hypothetical protein